MENVEQKTQLIVVPIEVINPILMYLGKRPYEEVADLILNLQKEGKLLKEPSMVEQPIPVEPTPVPKQTRAPRKKVEEILPNKALDSL
jgi:hypothetical protein